MGRIARVVLPGFPHHVTQRGVRSMNIFFGNGDRAFYLSLLREQGKRFGLRFLSYCLMVNHVHLLVIPKREDSLARGIGEAHRRYTFHINSVYETKGYFFQGRFFPAPLDEQYLLAATKYVERNPVRAGLVKDAWNYRWSSARFHVGLRSTDPLVEDRTLLGLVSDWRGFLGIDVENLKNLRDRLRTGRPCGDQKFLSKAEELTGRRLQRQIPGRPKIWERLRIQP